jgi:hypothetical protein
MNPIKTGSINFKFLRNIYPTELHGTKEFKEYEKGGFLVLSLHMSPAALTAVKFNRCFEEGHLYMHTNQNILTEQGSAHTGPEECVLANVGTFSKNLQSCSHTTMSSRNAIKLNIQISNCKVNLIFVFGVN